MDFKDSYKRYLIICLFLFIYVYVLLFVLFIFKLYSFIL